MANSMQQIRECQCLRSEMTTLQPDSFTAGKLYTQIPRINCRVLQVRTGQAGNDHDLTNGPMIVLYPFQYCTFEVNFAEDAIKYALLFDPKHGGFYF